MNHEEIVILLNKYSDQLVESGMFSDYMPRYYLGVNEDGVDIKVMLKKVSGDNNIWHSQTLTNQEAIDILERYESMLGFCSIKRTTDDN